MVGPVGRAVAFCSVPASRKSANTRQPEAGSGVKTRDRSRKRGLLNTSTVANVHATDRDATHRCGRISSFGLFARSINMGKTSAMTTAASPSNVPISTERPLRAGPTSLQLTSLAYGFAAGGYRRPEGVGPRSADALSRERRPAHHTRSGSWPARSTLRFDWSRPTGGARMGGVCLPGSAGRARRRGRRCRQARRGRL